MIRAVIVINDQGKPRLVKFYDYQPVEKQQEIIRNIYGGLTGIKPARGRITIKLGRDDGLKHPTCYEFVHSCPNITTLAIKGFKLHGYKARMLVKGLRKLKIVDFSTPYSFTGAFLKFGLHEPWCQWWWKTSGGYDITRLHASQRN
uniref:Putative adaptor protein complex, sigma subunit, AP complex, mu/sigma subunit n=1 Tax=Helianthus annuus TaxID=4232 RepID=A0A251TFL4_HELAN